MVDYEENDLLLLSGLSETLDNLAGEIKDAGVIKKSMRILL